MCLCFCDFTTSIRRKPNVVTFSFVHNCQSHDVLPFYEIKLRNLALIVFWVSFAPMVQNHRKIIPLRQTFRPFIEPQQRQSALIHTPKIYQAKKQQLTSVLSNSTSIPLAFPVLHSSAFLGRIRT